MDLTNKRTSAIILAEYLQKRGDYLTEIGKKIDSASTVIHSTYIQNKFGDRELAKLWSQAHRASDDYRAAIFRQARLSYAKAEEARKIAYDDSLNEEHETLKDTAEDDTSPANSIYAAGSGYQPAENFASDLKSLTERLNEIDQIISKVKKVLYTGNVTVNEMRRAFGLRES